MMKKQKLLILGIVAIGISSIIFSTNIPNDTFQFEMIGSNDIPRAVIIDQLHRDFPNEDFQNTVTEYFEGAGYNVDLYTTDEITVDFYKELPSMNYDFIVVRAHALGRGVPAEEPGALFTGEKYTAHKYIKEQFLGHVSRGVTLLAAETQEIRNTDAMYDQTYFVIGSKMIDELMVGNFTNSTIILGGCETLQDPYLADSLLERGASEIIGWDNLVSARDNDNMMMLVLEQTLVYEVEIEEAVQFVNKEFVDVIMEYHTNLVYRSTGA